VNSPHPMVGEQPERWGWKGGKTAVLLVNELEPNEPSVLEKSCNNNLRG